MSTEATIFTGVAVYLVIMLFIGAYAAKRTHSSVDFMVAGRRMSIWICAATLMATWFGGSTMMGSSGAAYEGGFLRIIADPFGGALALFVVGFFFARIFRRLRLEAMAPRVYQSVVVTRTMPLGNLTGMTDEERELLARWYAGLTP